MAKVSLVEQLNSAIELVLAGSDEQPRVDTRIAAQLRIAAALRDRPRSDFKARLKADLERRASMTRAVAKPIREGFHTITPYLIVPGAADLIDFVKQAFAAEELYRGTGSAGGIHAEVRIGDSMVMIGGGGAWRGTPRPTGLHLYVKDADAVYQSALQAGAISLGEPVDQPYGDREASVKDLSGNHWYIATHKGTGHTPEGLRAVTPFLHPRGAVQLIDFLKQAFGAEEESRYQSPDGVVQHATVRIGDSMIEMGEAHGPWQPMPTTFFMYVDDVDGLYRRAVGAGAASQSEPADQPYGDRVAGVTDPFDNTWYIATHISDSLL
jgi:PhnB protein